MVTECCKIWLRYYVQRHRVNRLSTGQQPADGCLVVYRKTSKCNADGNVDTANLAGQGQDVSDWFSRGFLPRIALVDHNTTLNNSDISIQFDKDVL